MLHHQLSDYCQISRSSDELTHSLSDIEYFNLLSMPDDLTSVNIYRQVFIRAALQHSYNYAPYLQNLLT